MSFDLFFVVAQSEDEACLAIRQARGSKRAATADEEVRMRRLVARLLEISPDAIVHPDRKGLAHGVWVGVGNFPDFEIGPQCVFCSFHPSADPHADQRMRELITLFEELGYLAFDPQAGRAVASKHFSFQADPGAAPGRIKQPWWKFW